MYAVGVEAQKCYSPGLRRGVSTVSRSLQVIFPATSLPHGRCLRTLALRAAARLFPAVTGRKIYGRIIPPLSPFVKREFSILVKFYAVSPRSLRRSQCPAHTDMGDAVLQKLL